MSENNNPWTEFLQTLNLDESQRQRTEQLVQSARSAESSPLPDLLAERFIAAQELSCLLSQFSGLPWLDVDSLPPQPIEPQLDGLIHRYQALPFNLDQDSLALAVGDPFWPALVEDFRFATGRRIHLFVADSARLQAWIQRNLSEWESGLGEFPASSVKADTPLGLSTSPTSHAGASTLQIVEHILNDAVHARASDIHLEPLPNRLRIRLRIDGLLHESRSLSGAQSQRVLTRIKVLANLDIAERRIPQDGKLQYTPGNGRAVDLRISSLPTLYGEKLVLRILDRSRRPLDIDELGLDPQQRARFRAALARPQGMVLVTGPTGSGKTVTLYSALHYLNTDTHNLSTAEDPVEIHLDGVNQVNIAPHAGMGFASILRALLRQDPDIIMVGEVRDTETAEIAIKAAQTGHLVLSTLHTNDAPQALTRLLSMGVPPYLIAGSVHFLLAQRLLRRLCPICREPDLRPWPDWVQESLKFLEKKPEALLQKIPSIYRAIGCSRCKDGYSGRIAIFETLEVSDIIQTQLLRGDSTQEITATAIRQGYRPLRSQGLLPVFNGLTTFEELERVTVRAQ